jgi:hypothetical protein
MLQDTGAIVVQNRAYETEIGGKPVIVSGASDLWQRRQDFGFSSGLPAYKPILLLTRNPDTALYVQDAFNYDLMLAGHTHGSQVRIRCSTSTSFRCGARLTRNSTGSRRRQASASSMSPRARCMAGVPLRFLMSPPIDILTVLLPERKKPRRATGAFELVQRNPDQPASVWDLVACT